MRIPNRTQPTNKQGPWGPAFGTGGARTVLCAVRLFELNSTLDTCGVEGGGGQSIEFQWVAGLVSDRPFARAVTFVLYRIVMLG